MKTALINGISGQDGIYLAKILREKDYHVVGITKNKTKTIPILLNNFIDDIEIMEWDMKNQDGIKHALYKSNPDEFYNLAAFTSGEGMYDNVIEMVEINGVAVTRILKAINEVNTSIRFCQASSREIFGLAKESPQSEKSEINPRSPYGAAKSYADSMIRIYREKYNNFACSAILYNHESPLRKIEFVTRKIAFEVAKIKMGLSKELHLGNLETERDWGFAKDYCYAMWLMLQQDSPEDFVISTNISHTIREFCEIAFSYLELDYRDFVIEDKSIFRPSEPQILIGNNSKAKEILNWSPSVTFYDLVTMMVESDFQNLQNSLKTS